MERLQDVSPLPKQSRNAVATVPATIFLPSACLPGHQNERFMARRSRPRQTRSFQENSFVIPSFITVPFTKEGFTEDSCSQRYSEYSDEILGAPNVSLFSNNIQTRWEERGHGLTTKSHPTVLPNGEASYQLPPTPPTPPSRKASNPDLFGDAPESTLCDPTPPKMPRRLPHRSPRRRHSDQRSDCFGWRLPSENPCSKQLLTEPLIII